MISSNFQTDWYYPPVYSGNYGIRITFETLNGEQLEYILDTNKMVGDPLNYT
jgi:hypothetical protein